MWIYNDVNYYQDFFWNSETGLLQQTHRQRRHFTQIYAMIFKTSIKHLKGESSTNLPSPISKSTKHGYVTLALPKCTFLVDLTVHMDIKANPGPETQEIQENRIGNRSCSDLNSRATGTIRYSRNELLNLRSKYPISDHLHSVIKSQNIIRSRGGRSGLSNRNKIFRISTVLQRRNPMLYKQQRSTNLHNLRSLERNNVNKRKGNQNQSQGSRNLDGSFSTCSGLTIFHLNIQSLRNSAHLIQLRELVKSEKYDIVTISETWLNTNVTSGEIKLDDYKVFRLDRLHKRGGGVCAYVRKELKTEVLKDYSYISDSNFHQLWLRVQLKKLKSIVVCVTYRPQDCPLNCFEDDLKPTYLQSIAFNKPIVILGDLNCDVLKESRPEFKALNNFASEMNLRQLIKSPTRITATTETAPDVILVSSTSFVRKSGIINLSISDHMAVFVELKVKAQTPPPYYISVRSYKNYSPTMFSGDLAANSTRLLSIFDTTDVNAQLNIFNDVLQSTLDSHAPVRTIKVRNRPCPFVTRDIKQLMDNRNSLHRRFLQTRDAPDWEKYKASRNTVKRVLTEAERSYTHQEVQENKNDPRSLWKIINRTIPSKEKERQVYTKNPKTVANEFNAFFSKVGRNASDTVAQLAEEINIIHQEPFFEPAPPPQCDLFNFRSVSVEEVRRIISAMPTNKSPGPDKVEAWVLKDSLSVILGPLTEIINCSLATSTFPDAWKAAEVIPLLKEGDHNVASNNRPLSLLPVASKVCERIVLNQLSGYLSDHNRLTHHQNGNKKLHSTETLSIYITDNILEAMDNKKITVLILLDLSKAFDSINHQRLLKKLTSVGASPATVKWFESYLSHRTQTLRIGSTLSDPLTISHGVPQGAILSPLLFCIYTNDLPNTPLTCEIESYVDDSKILRSFHTLESETAMLEIEEDLHRVAIWCCENHLLINPEKTKFLLLGTRQLMNRLPAQPSLSFLGKTLTPVSSAKDLGLTLDSHLSYDDHISKLTSSCLFKLMQINRVRQSFDQTTLLKIMSTLVFSKMFYCSTVWSNTTNKNITKLQLLQNFACKIVTGTRKYDHVSPLLRQLNWKPVQQCLDYRDLVLTYKCVKNLAPEYLCKKFQKCPHDRATRNRDLFQIPRFKTSTGQRTFSYRAVKLWNNLDKDVKDSKSLNSFKKALKALL